MVKVFVPEFSLNSSYAIRCKFDAQCPVQVSGVGFPTAEDTQEGIAFVTAYLLLDREVQFNTAVLFKVGATTCVPCAFVHSISLGCPVAPPVCLLYWWFIFLTVGF